MRMSGYFAHSIRTLKIHKPMEQSDLRLADEAILDVLKEGRATKGLIVDETGYSRNTVYNCLEVLDGIQPDIAEKSWKNYSRQYQPASGGNSNGADRSRNGFSTTTCGTCSARRPAAASTIPGALRGVRTVPSTASTSRPGRAPTRSRSTRSGPSLAAASRGNCRRNSIARWSSMARPTGFGTPATPGRRRSPRTGSATVRSRRRSTTTPRRGRSTSGGCRRASCRRGRCHRSGRCSSPSRTADLTCRRLS